jgi:cobalt-zinc-cadmium efflux system outer membrane protein
MCMSFSRPPIAAGFAVVVAGFALSASAIAQPAPPYEALIERLDRNPATLEAEALLDAANARAEQARALPNPSLSLEAENVYGRAPFSGYDAAETTLSVTQPLEIWGQRGARIDAARAQANAAALRRDQSRWTVAGRLALIYAEAEAASLQHDLAAEALVLTQADADATMALIDAGREPALRGIQAASEVDAARAVVAEAQANRDAAFARLAAAAQLTDSVTSISTSLLLRQAGAESGGHGDALAVRIAEAEVQAADRSVTVQRLRARPDVSASLGVRRFEELDTQALTVGLNVSIPLFDRNAGAISAARAEQRAAQARLAGSRFDAQADRIAAQASIEAALIRTRAGENGVDAAREAYRLARAGFEAGRISQFELRSIRAALIAARNTAVDARLARVRAEVELARLDGRAPF